MMRKYTVDDAVRNEIECFADAIAAGNFLEDDSLTRYCGEELAQVLAMVPHCERGRFMEDYLHDGREFAAMQSVRGNQLVLPIGEIETQFEGPAEECFEDVNDWTIRGDLAYCLCDAISFDVDVAALRRAIELDKAQELASEPTDDDGRHPQYRHLVMVEAESHYGSYIVTSKAAAGSMLVSGEDMEHMSPALAEDGFAYVSDEYLDQFET